LEEEGIFVPVYDTVDAGAYFALFDESPKNFKNKMSSKKNPNAFERCAIKK
jgi:hypothetical protein